MDKAKTEISEEPVASTMSMSVAVSSVMLSVVRSFVDRCSSHAGQARSLHVVFDLFVSVKRSRSFVVGATEGIFMDRSMSSKTILLILVEHFAFLGCHLCSPLLAAGSSAISTIPEDTLAVLTTLRSESEHLSKPSEEAAWSGTVLVVLMAGLLGRSLLLRQCHAHDRTRHGAMTVKRCFAIDCKSSDLVDLVA
jgi:hypothetical protein